MRRASKIDDNQPEIVETLRQIPGCAVKSMAAVGDGFPDLLVWYRGYYLMEVKDGSKSPSRRSLTPDQEIFHRMWPGPIHIVLSADDALRVIGVI